MNCVDQNITVVDYGMGNLQSVANAFAFLGAKVQITDNPELVANADAIVLPGVGAFGKAMSNLHSSGLVEALNHAVIARKKPFLGICLGMQLIAEESDELGKNRGLGWVPGHVRLIKTSGNLRVPHVGWNNVSVKIREPLFAEVPDDANFYFVHSLHFECPAQYASLTCDYGITIVAAIQKENIFATQFHPEKSQHHGLRILRNFVRHLNSTSKNAECKADIHA